MSKQGRPPLPDSERADVYLHIRVKASDKAKWVKQAQAKGQKLSEWVTNKLK